jgi:hypothetical protein
VETRRSNEQVTPLPDVHAAFQYPVDGLQGRGGLLQAHAAEIDAGCDLFSEKDLMVFDTRDPIESA